ncbi:histone deacetylase family protein [Pseudoroseicyclus aestuarii]|nr:histone deacetylase family protein [Pseudoroseicyclus aestuarii]
MVTALITHSACLGHDTPPGHPERVERLRTVLAVLDGMDLQRHEAPMAAEADILRVHPESHLRALREAAPEEGLVALDGDTFLSPGSLEAAWRCVGAALKGVDLVLGGQAQTAFAAVRPPGHHAERETAMGFCLFGTVAAAAKYALDHHGLARVAILDFDVHHGNGTQDLVEDDPRILFCSSHQAPLFPGTGAAHETGADDNVVNVPLPAGTDWPTLRRAWNRTILPRVEAFAPEMIFISAGFDCHRADPLGGMTLEAADFGLLTERIMEVAEECCGGRVVSVLEGGYDLAALAAGVAEHVNVLKGGA